jgi:superfamily II DNA or RNA helicase
VPILAALAADDLGRVPASVAAWSLAAKLALDLVARERVTPVITTTDAGAEARWGVSLALAEDAERFRRLAAALPPAAHAMSAGDGARAWGPEDLLLEFLDAVADGLVRADGDAPVVLGRWEGRFAAALTAPAADPVFLAGGVLERGLVEALAQWAATTRGAPASRAPRLCLKLDVPDGGERADWRLGYLLQAPDDPSLLLPAADVWRAAGGDRDWLDRTFGEPREVLLRELGRAGRFFRPIEASLDGPAPEAVRLDTRWAWGFLSEAAPALGEAGFGVLLPAELAPSGERRLRLRMRVGGGVSAKVAGAVAGTGLSLDTLVEYRWEAALGDQPITTEEFQRLAAMKRPLVQWRGQWVVLDPAEIAEVRRFLAQKGGRVTAREALAAALGETLPREGARPPVSIVAEGPLAVLIERLRDGAVLPPVPADLAGSLRPYQHRGLGWLATMAAIGLGGCLADDMGLGKTVQTIAFLLAQRDATPGDTRPSLVVCPTSVLGNWERELARFAPALPVVRHYGTGRARAADALAGAPPYAVVVTSYSLLRRDRELLGAVDWSTAILDEAQNVKNSAAQQAVAARALRASRRFALTGTPVENRLAELWSILEFCAPGYLGPLAAFRQRFAVPIERYRDEYAAARLRALVRPFVLRRLKTDEGVAADLPSKQEMAVVCTLTREQATLYKAAVDEALAKIQEREGIQRRGLVLALLTALKQICNHPAQYLHERGPLAGRSGKLARITEMLEETLAAGDRVLVFTQYKEMGDRLVAHLEAELATEVLFLHGGTPRAARERMIARFQEAPDAPGIFILSLKAGGTGLNLTRATRVVHFDRWWNPAVEDQATDRAHRIGQSRAVQVYRLLAAGTVEEKIDRMLTDKRALADRVVGAGETWITELPDAELRRLVTLSGDAAVVEEV